MMGEAEMYGQKIGLSPSAISKNWKQTKKYVKPISRNQKLEESHSHGSFKPELSQNSEESCPHSRSS